MNDPFSGADEDQDAPTAIDSVDNYGFSRVGGDYKAHLEEAMQ
jgi:hypothetical protein